MDENQNAFVVKRIKSAAWFTETKSDFLSIVSLGFVNTIKQIRVNAYTKLTVFHFRFVKRASTLLGTRLALLILGRVTLYAALL